jgi:hypothetical protein
MFLECTPKEFKPFVKEGWSEYRKGLEIFLYNAWYEFGEPSGFALIDIPELDNETFRDWVSFEDWCEQINRNLMWELFGNVDIDTEAPETSTPKKFFKSKRSLKTKIIDHLCSSPDTEQIYCVEIVCGKEKRFLLYFDSDAWTLGHGSSVLVVKSLESLIKKRGFFPLA